MEIVLAVVFVSVLILTRLAIKVLRRRAGSVTAGKRVLPPSLPHLPLIGSLPFLPEFQDWAAYFTDKSKLEFGSVIGLQLGPQ